MRSIRVHTLVGVGLALSLSLIGCGGDGGGSDSGSLLDAPAATTDDAGSVVTDDTGPVSDHAVTIAFQHLVDGAPITIGSDTPYTNAAGNQFGVTRLSYFVSDVTLTTTGGRVISLPGAHYVDHDTAETTRIVLPAGTAAEELASVSFHMGLPPALNVTGAFSSPPESLMEWPVMMGGGYHHMKLEGRYLNAAMELFNYRVHSGALGGVDYSFPVVLDATGLSIGGHADVTLTVAMNLEEWFTGPNDWDLNDYFNAAMPGIMGNAAAQASLQENGAGVFTLVRP